MYAGSSPGGMGPTFGLGSAEAFGSAAGTSGPLAYLANAWPWLAGHFTAGNRRPRAETFADRSLRLREENKGPALALVSV